MKKENPKMETEVNEEEVEEEEYEVFFIRLALDFSTISKSTDFLQHFFN